MHRFAIQDSEDVRFWLIKFFFSPLIYQHPDTIRNLIKEQGLPLPNLCLPTWCSSLLDVLHEIFSGLVYDSRQTVEFVLHELRTNVSVIVLSATERCILHGSAGDHGLGSIEDGQDSFV